MNPKSKYMMLPESKKILYRKKMREWSNNNKERINNYYKNNPDIYKKHSKNQAIEAAFKCLSYYKKGKKIECVFCKESEYEFMSLDHIDGNGSEHRRLNGYKSGTSTYLWAIRNNYPPIFQVACMSCNHARSRRGSVDGKPNDKHLAYLSKFIPTPKLPDNIPKSYNEKIKFKCFNTKTVNLIREHKNNLQRKWTFDRKIKILTYYSKHDYIACECCGEMRLVRLTLDHEKNNGGIERKKLSGLPSGCSSTKLYKKIIDENFPPGYQVQCMNCNHGRGRNNNPDHICPHKRK